MSKKLLIVESPAKAKTIGKYLGSEFVVKSSVGHIRDLPKENNAIKITPDGENHWRFEPTYEISDGKQKVVSELKAAVKDCDEIYLASDPDREGEAIAWHLRETLSKSAGDKPFHRVTYNEITKSAVLKAVAEPREIDMPRVDAQQARRILDRLVGYKVSPLLWRNINCANNRTLSAGRVQSVALRLLVERQREIDAFKPVTFYLLGVEAKKGEETFTAKLARFDGEKPDIKDRQAADNVLLDLNGASLEVTELKVQPKTRHALPPFTTSTLQQAASSVLGFSPGKTMKLAQSLYEAGRITYMRTDSVNVSDQARDAAKAFIEKYLGPEFYPDKPNVFRSKESAQEAHEAIRPTDVELSPKRAADALEAAELKLYELIWKRFLASQMADAKTEVKTVSLKALKGGLMHEYLFTASATEVLFEGFLKVMQLSLKKKTKDGEDDEDSDEVSKLPQLAVGDELEAVRWLADEKQTKGPKHYSEASLIKALEENGVGRPSTYAATIETLKVREYAKTEKKKLVPMERGFLVCDWLVGKLDSLFNVGYTAEMEAELDKVEEQGEPMNAMLSDFYAKFLTGLEACKPPAPASEKFEPLFAMLSEVKAWKDPKTVGRRVYDDRKFVESVKEQFVAGKEMSARQLEALTRMVMSYSAQIADSDNRLREAGLLQVGQPVKAPVETADAELVRYCFETVGRIGGLEKNRFLKSLREQHDKGRELSVKQFSILARMILENCEGLSDAAEVKAKLEPLAPAAEPKQVEANAAEVEPIIAMLDRVGQWKPPVTRGKRTYDDKEFYKSIHDQFRRRGGLSRLQVAALKRLCKTYKDQIPDYRDPDGDKGTDQA